MMRWAGHGSCLFIVNVEYLMLLNATHEATERKVDLCYSMCFRAKANAAHAFIHVGIHNSAQASQASRSETAR